MGGASLGDAAPRPRGRPHSTAATLPSGRAGPCRRGSRASPPPPHSLCPGPPPPPRAAGRDSAGPRRRAGAWRGLRGSRRRGEGEGTRLAMATPEDGKGFLEALVSAGEAVDLNEAPVFDTLALHGIRDVAATPGRLQCSLPVTPHIQNRNGTLHGGCIGWFRARSQPCLQSCEGTTLPCSLHNIVSAAQRARGGVDGAQAHGRATRQAGCVASAC